MNMTSTISKTKNVKRNQHIGNHVVDNDDDFDDLLDYVAFPSSSTEDQKKRKKVMDDPSSPSSSKRKLNSDFKEDCVRGDTDKASGSHRDGDAGDAGNKMNFQSTNDVNDVVSQADIEKRGA